MATPGFVVYKGRKYWLQSNGRYYQDGSHYAPERLLHRVIWIEHFGPIPKGLCVHHKNHDWRDNKPSNLSLISKSEHSTHHLKARFENPEFRARNLQHLIKAQIGAAKWHGSPAGLKWHRENGVRTMAQK